MSILGGGTYAELRITQTSIQPHKEGEPKIVIRLEDPASTEWSITDYLYTSNAAWDKMTKKRLKAYGFDVETTPLFNLDETDERNPILGKLVGPVVVEEEEYQGKPQYRVARVGEFVNERLAPDAKRSLELALASRLGVKPQALGGAPPAAKKKAAPPKPVEEPVPAGNVPDDDVPF